MRVIFNLMAAAALILLGFGLVLSGLHAMPQAYGVAFQGAGQADSAAAPVAQLVGYGTDKEAYSRGDTANGYIMLKNTGSSVINDVTVSASASRSVPLLGATSLGSKDFTFKGLNIKPGETKNIAFSVDIPGKFMGFSTAGEYYVNGNVLVGGKSVGSFSRHIKVT